MPLHVVSGSQLNALAPSLEFFDKPFSMPKDMRPSYSRHMRSEPYPSMAPIPAPAPSSSPRRESITSSTATVQERPSTAWSAEDDARLMDLRKQGYNWGPVAQYFHGKTSNACRKRHERLMERQHNTEFDGPRVEELSNAYFQCREQMWKVLADFLNEPRWQMLESKCYGQGFKNLQAASRQNRSRPRNGSPSGSDQFDDSGLGLGHSSPENLLPMPQHTSQSPPSLRTSRESSSYPVSRPTMEAPRPPILAAPPTQYSYPPPPPQHQQHHPHHMYTTSYTSQGLSLPPPTAAVSHQTLPSLTRAFNVNELPPPVSAAFNSRHISASYG